MGDPRVTILKRNGDQTLNYPDYTTAISNSVAGDVLIIKGDLNEQIVLKDKVDIWIMPGVILNNTTTDPLTFGPTITDKNIAVDCKIYGLGKIINSSVYSCIKIENSNTKLEVECESIQSLSGVSVYILPSKKFHLKCNYVYSKNFQAIRIGEFGQAGMVDEVRLDVNKVETGDVNNSSTGTTALSTRGNGFIRIDEIICNNVGHCLSHQEGTVTARIQKMTTVNNRANSHASTVHVPGPTQGTGTQKLILYFDEIKSLRVKVGSQYLSDDGIQVTGGTGIFIGRSVFSTDSYAIQINNPNTRGYVKCDKAISEKFFAIGLNDFTNLITLDINYIEGNQSGVIYAYSSVNFELKNAKIKNVNANLPARVLTLYRANGIIPKAILNNIKLITNNDLNNEIIYAADISSPSIPINIDIKNYGLFVNDSINPVYINLLIGNDLNYLYINSVELT